MSKTLGKILAVAAVVAAVVLAPEIAGPLGIGALAASSGALITAGLAALALVNGLLMPKIGAQPGQQRQASVVTLSIGEGPRQALIGEPLAGGSLLDAVDL